MRKKILNVCLPALMLLASTVAWAQIPTVKVYQIGTAEELKAFADAVNNGENYAHGILTADIDYGTENTMIGRDGMDFQGCLDGQGHTLTINMTGSADGQALCRNLGVNGRVQNLVIKGTITTAFKYAAAVAAWSGGTVTNVKSELTVNSSISGDGTHAGIVAVPGAGSLIANCMAIFTIDGPQTNNCGGIVGWASDRCIVENCLAINNFTLSGLDGSASISRNAGSMLKAYNNYYLNATGDGAGGTQVSAEDLASGKVCFLLNHDQRNIQWTQTIGTDPYPVPFTTQSTVYCSAATKCDGTSDDAGATYSNTATNAIATAHTLVGGACTTCKSLINGSAAKRSIPQGYVVPNYVARDENDIYVVKTADDMDWLSIIHAVGNEAFNLKLMNDIDYTSRNEWLNQENWYSGVFDGQGYTLKIALGAGNTTAIMPNFAGDIKNVVIEGTIDTGTKQFAAAVTSHTRNANRTPSISNVASNVAITSAKEGDGTHGGLIGVNEVESRISNSIFLGSITSSITNNCGGLIGWCSSPCFISDAIQAGTISIASGDNNTIARNPGNLRMENVYYVTANGDTPGGITQITNTDDLKSGKITFELNKSNTTDPAWRQNLGTDLYPMPISSHAIVYAAPAEGFRCDGKPQGETSYTNEASASTIPPHTFADGFCQVCSTYDPDFLKPDADGFYQLKSGRDLAWFSHKVSDGKQGNLSAKLMNDINMTDEDNAVFVSIANSSDAAYSGTFDGQGYTISNLKVVRPTYAGLFGYATGGATIKNFTLDKTCSITSEGGFAGLIGGSTGSGTITMECLGNEATVMGAAQNVAGIIGVNMGSAAAFIIRNCYVSGSVSGANECAAITGWAGGSQSLIENCWSTATITGNDSGKPFYRNDDTRVVNCYNLTGEQATKMTEEQLKSGELAYLLNGKTPKNAAWFQTLGTDEYPVPNATHKKVYLLGEAYVNDYATTPELVDGIYQIKNAADLNGFAQIVNGGQSDANAVLTDNIDMSGIELTAIGKSGYNGRFDGGCFAINNLESDGALFGIVKPGAFICDLTINGTIVGDNNTAAFADEVTNTTAAPVADLLDVVFKEDGTAEDVSPMHNTVERVGEGISVYYNETLKRYVARFDNPYGGNCTGFYQTPSYEAEDNAVHTALADGHTLEVLCMADFDGAIPNAEAKPFSAMQAGGTGFLVCKTNAAGSGGKNVFTFLPNVTTSGNSTWRWTTSDVQPETQVFYHVVGVWNKEEQKSYIYVNGKLSNVIDAPGDMKFASAGCNWFAIGGDPANATSAHGSWKGDVALARAYDKALTEDEAKALWMKLQDETSTADMVQLIDCHNNATVKGAAHTGGLIGHAESAADKPMTLKVDNCSNTGNVNGDTQTGGLIGYAKVNAVEIVAVKNEGTVTGRYHLGGVIGRVEKVADTATLNISFSENTGEVTAERTSVAGICGVSLISNTIENCTNSGTITGSGCVGGIMGNSAANVTACVNKGTIIGTAAYGELKIGGIFGNADGVFTITDSHNEGEIIGQPGTMDSSNQANGNAGGVIGVATKSFTMTNCYNTGNVTGRGNNCGGVIGRLSSGVEFTIQNCWNTGDVVSTLGENAGGIIGGAQGSPTPHILNCYNTGKVEGNKNSAAIAGWLGNNNPAEVKNCWNIGQIVNGAGNNTMYRRGGTGTFTRENNYDLSGTVEEPTTATPPAGYTAEWLENGHFAYYINNVACKSIYRQNIGEDKTPVLDDTKGIVYGIGAAGYGTLFNTETALSVPAGVTASTAVIKGNWISLTEVSDAIPAATPVVLQGAEGFYSFMPADEAGTAGENDLKGTAEPLAATGIQYVLAEKDGVAGFYQAAEGTKIPAGKAYIEKAAAGVKGFFFGDATGIAEVETATEADAAIYDLSGRRVEKAQKGIYIVNGKKVMK